MGRKRVPAAISLDPAVLCKSAPELLDSLRAKIEVLKKMDQRLQDDPDATELHSNIRRQQRGTEDRAAILRERPQLQTDFENLRFHVQAASAWSLKRRMCVCIAASP